MSFVRIEVEEGSHWPLYSAERGEKPGVNISKLSGWDRWYRDVPK